MARLVIIGASGGIGSHIRAEALARGHSVTAVTRHAALEGGPRLTPVKGDIADTAGLTAILRGHDAVISAYSPGLSTITAEVAAALIESAHTSLLAATRAAGLRRIVIVGGVGSLQAEPDRPGDVVDAPFYPAEHKAHILMNREILRGLRAKAGDLDWTYVSPPLDIFEGERRGSFRLGGDVLLRDGEGKSRISRADFAIAILNAVDGATHLRQRFTAAY